MKKAIITAIILINCTTLYFWIFPYQSRQDLHAFQLADKTLKHQNEIIGTGCESVIKAIQKNAEAYPINQPYVEKAKTLHELSKANYAIIQGLRDSILNQLPKTFRDEFYFRNDDKAFDLKYRIRPFQYRIPKKVMNNHLAKARKELNENQSKMLELIEADSFTQIVSDSFLIKVDDLSRLFKKVSIVESMALLSGLQTQTKVLEYRILDDFAVTTSHQSNNGTFQEFVPIVHANTSNLKIGDTYEAEVFAASYLNGNNIRATANGKEIPVENGIALYTVKPTSVGKKKVNISMSITNPLTKETRTYKREFEYDVVDCD